MKSLLVPYTLGRRFNIKFLAAVQLVILLAVWTAAPASAGFPSLLSIAAAWNSLALQHGLLVELFSSMTVILQALLFSAIISIGIAYLTTADLFKPVGTFVASLRFLGFAGLTFIFTLWTSNGNQLKLALLTFGMTVFLTRSTIDEVRNVQGTEIDYGRSLGLSGWALTWEMIGRGRLANMLDLFRQNAAIGWTLIVIVESYVRSDGGIGALLAVQAKYFNLPAVFAIQLTILFYGILQDQLLILIRKLVCPYTELNRSDK